MALNDRLGMVTEAGKQEFRIYLICFERQVLSSGRTSGTAKQNWVKSRQVHTMDLFPKYFRTPIWNFNYKPVFTNVHD